MDQLIVDVIGSFVGGAVGSAAVIVFHIRRIAREEVRGHIRDHHPEVRAELEPTS